MRTEALEEALSAVERDFEGLIDGLVTRVSPPWEKWAEWAEKRARVRWRQRNKLRREILLRAGGR